MGDQRLGWPRSEFWEPRWVLGRDVRRMIAELDPARDDAEITHLSLEVLTPPMFAHLGYASAGIRVNAVPRAAKRVVRDGTGDQILRPWVRDADTLTFFSELMRRGHRSAAGVAACERIQGIHKSVGGVLNEDQIYTLCTLIFYSETLAQTMGHQVHAEVENEARLSFWLGVARHMRLRDVPQTRVELLAWMEDYESRHFAPAPECRAAAEAHIRAIERWFPGPLKPLAQSIMVATMDDRLRDCLEYEPPSAVTLAAMRTGWRSFAMSTPMLPMRLDSSWVKSFSRVGPNPDLERIGYGTYGDRPAVSASAPGQVPT
jgi:ER-bound oxygenase mpaB/B'/Rubber oxygenase, catalytic domain